ncbi:MFS transporter [Ruminococcus flavefaciens]|uniref:GPH family glycoside/pentoside/hexuronide:cation symporter n=1 Tax=Ruminococcus flavefaciens TaxID=1265 RepID=A0A315XT90_RUMFL|nr:MFS transporter [Ruminococcus flavefaciens]PWJ09698.1 GPH family glycoside/pentoside/hexuronide:cation symporter [Ruminococcus flavefaciens]SSA52263.1 glycoside/pentoside/hexuronide:cation symporter, GPH family [Ruminococcus flavefaciens]
MQTKKTATNKILWIFAVGQLGWSLLSGIIANWLVFFYQPSSEELDKGQLLFIPKGTFIGLTAIGIITAFGRIFDAVTDPYIAGKSDSLKHRLGRRIPFMRFAAIPFGVVTVLMFVSPFGEKSMGNAVFLFVFAMMFYFCMTCYCTPYNALIPELGSTQNTRINLSTFISVTYFFGTAIAYLVPNIAGIFMNSLGYAASFRVTIAILAAVAVICMLVPAFLIDENLYADTTPSKSTAFKSLLATFRNKDFRVFVCSDILYWIGLTLFQTGLSFYITVLLGLDSGMTFPLFAIMTVVSLAFYPLVNIFSKKMGKKKLIAFAFLFFSFAFLVTAAAGLIGIPAMVYGVIIAVLAAVPMAILGILPQAVVADISEADKLDTGESRQGMFYAARTFAFKLGQSLAMLMFTSIALINSDAEKGSSGYGLGYRLTALLAAVLCLLGGLVFLRYNEKKVINRIEEGSKNA